MGDNVAAYHAVEAMADSTRLPAADAPRMDIIQRGFEMIANTCPFDVTGHPSMSVPCGMSDGAASAFEKAGV